MIKINDKYFDTFIDKNRILSEVAQLATFLNSDYKGQEVIFISVLNGSFMFTSDLMKNIDLDCEVSFIKVKSYSGTSSTGEVNEIIGLTSSITNKHIVILEDIVDSGLTLDKIKKLITKENPKSLKTCALMFKPEAFKGEFKPEYIGFSIANEFVVGYGMDYNEKGRNLEDIYLLNKEEVQVKMKSPSLVEIN